MSSWLHEPTARFLAQLTLVVLSARVLGGLATKIGQPRVVAEIAAGILLGPSLLGWAAPSVGAALFPAGDLTALGLVSQLGVVLFMFLIGLELDPGQLTGRGPASLAISHAGTWTPFAMGLALAIPLAPELAPPGVPFFAFALFLGTSLCVTAFPVLARILTERQLLHSPLGSLAVACAAVGDLTAWCLLACVVALVRAGDLMGAVTTTALAAAFVAVMVLWVRPVLERLGARVGQRSALTQGMVAVLLAALLVSSLITELIGIHALFGAFLLGVILPRNGGLVHHLAEKLEDLVLVLLLPLFFVMSGLRTQVGLLSTPADWLITAAVIGVACAGKLGGTVLSARWSGLAWREAGALGVLMNTRGLMELVVLNVGLELGVISPKLFTMLVIMALVTTVMTTPLLELIYPREELTRELVERASLAPPPKAPRTAHTLICVANDRSGPGLLRLAAALGPRGAPHEITALTLRPVSDRASDQFAEEEEAPASSALAPLLDSAEAAGLRVDPVAFPSVEPAADMCRVAQVRSADLILLGWHRPLVGHTVLGGVVFEVMRDAASDVGVFIDRGLGEIRSILVPFVSTPHGRAALALARRLQQGTGAHVTVLHVHAPDRTGPGGAKAATEETFEQGESGGVTMRIVADANPAQVALEHSRQGHDLVIVGLGPEWGLRETRFGAQPEALLQDAPGSVLVVRAAQAVA